MKNEGRPLEKILHSKLKTGMWPSVALILEKVHYFLPKVPKVTLQLFRDSHQVNENERPDEFENLTVIVSGHTEISYLEYVILNT